jgi:hypothetical protein
MVQLFWEERCGNEMAAGALGAEAAKPGRDERVQIAARYI